MPFSKIYNAIQENNESLALDLVSKEVNKVLTEINDLIEISNDLSKQPVPDIKAWFLASQKKIELEKAGKELQKIIKKCNKKWGENKWKKFLHYESR